MSVVARRLEGNATGEAAAGGSVPHLYAVAVLVLTFGLLLSDYMSRQVLGAVFPLLKAQWHLSDTALGSLSGSVAVMVGLLTFPFSLLADRLGRVRSVTVMAILWSLATLACGLSSRYGEMLTARLCVGLGEAAYGSVGVAIVVGVFPARLRATIVGCFTAGGIFGSVIGMALGGTIAEQAGWRWAFVAMSGFGLLLAALYPFVVRENRIVTSAPNRLPPIPSAHLPLFDQIRRLFASLFPNPSVVLTYMGSGLGLFASASLISWLPSYLNRYFRMAPGHAAVTASAFVLAGGVGMISCGAIADRFAGKNPRSRLKLASVYCLLTAALCALAFAFPPGRVQLVTLGVALFVSAGALGPAGAAVADETDPAIHATVFATLTLANNFLGLASGPMLTGVFADRWNLLDAFRVLPLPAAAAAATFWMAYRYRSAG
jgi:MFS family permease